MTETLDRVNLVDQPRGEWRDTFDEAKDDAITTGLTSYVRSRRRHLVVVPVATNVQQQP